MVEAVTAADRAAARGQGESVSNAVTEKGEIPQADARSAMTGDTKGGDYVAFGDYGMVAMEPAWIKSNQIEACRITMSRYFRRGGKIYIRIFSGQARHQKARRDPHG